MIATQTAAQNAVRNTEEQRAGKQRLPAAFGLMLAIFALCPLAVHAAPRKDFSPRKGFQQEALHQQVSPHEIFYEVNLRAISEEGNLRGAEARLPAIRRLGATVVWLMPVYPVGQVRSAGGLGSPYSVADYTRVNPEFGDLSDLQRFVKRAHTLGLTVILDWVANHTAWDNPWLTEHKDWYRQDAAGNVIIPPSTGWQDVAQLDHNNTALRAEMIRSMEFWLDKADVDGFRCDAADFVPLAFWQPVIAAARAHSSKKLLLLAEGTRPDHYQAGFDYLYAWDFCTALKEVIGGGKPASRLRDTLAKERGRPLMHYATNHDESVSASAVSLYGGSEGAYAAFALAALYGGNPLVYDGEEIAWPQAVPMFTRSLLDWHTGQAAARQYTALLRMINTHEALRRGELSEFGNDDVIAFTRKLGREAFTILVNLRKTPTSLHLPSGKQDLVALGPFEVRILPSR